MRFSRSQHPGAHRYPLLGHQVETAYEGGWAELLNGDLIGQTETAGFDFLITTDRGIRYPQNGTGRFLGLLVLSTNDWTRLRRYKDRIPAAVNSMQPGAFLEFEVPRDA